MSFPSLTTLSAIELERRVRAREISPVAVVEALLQAIALHNPRLNAVVTLTAAARGRARDARRSSATVHIPGTLAPAMCSARRRLLTLSGCLPNEKSAKSRLGTTYVL